MHDGTWAFEFDNLTEGKLQRDSESKLTVFKRIAPQAAFSRVLGPAKAHITGLTLAEGSFFRNSTSAPIRKCFSCLMLTRESWACQMNRKVY